MYGVGMVENLVFYTFLIQNFDWNLDFLWAGIW